MKELKVGSIVFYEGRKCQITKKSEDKVTLKNLEVQGESDWTYLEIELTEIKERGTD